MNNKPLIVGLTGLAGSGKSTAAKLLLAKYPFDVFRLGNHIRNVLAERGLAISASNERAIQREIREQYGMAALMELSVPAIQLALAAGHCVLIESMCSFSEKTCLQDKVKGVPIHVVAVHAPMELREVWLRTRDQRPLSYQEMRERDFLEIDQLEKGKLLALADYHLVNSGDLERLDAELKELMSLLMSH